MPLTIHPLVPTRMVIELGRMTYLRNYGKPAWLPVPFFAIAGAEKKILVDTSGSAEDMAPLRGEPVEHLAGFGECLASIGWRAEEVEQVVLTHLMYDHCANARLLPNAEFLVQKAELAYAEDPNPYLAGPYHAKFWQGIDLKLIEGDYQLAPGIELWLSPGHSPGCQSVAVQTEKGLAVITGFCCTMENFADAGGGYWASDKTPEVIPSGLHTDALAAYQSAARVKRQADIIIPMHDPKLAVTKVIPG